MMKVIMMKTFVNPSQVEDDDKKDEIEGTGETKKNSDVVYEFNFCDFTAPLKHCLANHQWTALVVAKCVSVTLAVLLLEK